MYITWGTSLLTFPFLFSPAKLLPTETDITPEKITKKEKLSKSLKMFFSRTSSRNVAI